MSSHPPREHILEVALILAAIFDILAGLAFIRDKPVFFAAFMFVGQGILVVAIVLLLGAVLADLRAKQLL